MVMPLAGIVGVLFAGVVLIICLVVAAALYVYLALALQTIAKKTKTEPAWLAWIPIANLYLLLKIAKMSAWWLIGFIVPFLNLVVMIMAWWKVCVARGKPGWVSLLFIIPIVNLVIPGYLAWSK